MKILNIYKFLIVGFIAGSFNNHCKALDLRNMNGNPTRQAQNSHPAAQIIGSLIGILSNTFANEPSETHTQKKYIGGRPRQGRSRQLRSNTRTQASQRPQNYRHNNQMYQIGGQKRFGHAGISQRHNPSRNRRQTPRASFQQKQVHNNSYEAPHIQGNESSAYTY
jgi:hypothetical protein